MARQAIVDEIQNMIVAVKGTKNLDDDAKNITIGFIKNIKDNFTNFSVQDMLDNKEQLRALE